MQLQALPYVSFVGLLFGSTLVASRFSVGQFNPVIYIALRLLLASLCHLAIYGVRRRWPADRALWRHAVLLGIIGTAVPMTAMVMSLQYQSSGLTALLITTNPALTVLMAHVWLSDERLSRRKGIGIALALGGAALLVISGESGLPDISQANPIGYGLVAVAAILSSAMTVYARKYMKAFNAFDVASVRMFSAAGFLIPVSILFIGFDLHLVDGRGYMALLYAAFVGTFAGLMIAFYNIQRFGATAAAMTAYIIPIVAGIGGALVLGETFTPTMLVGMVVIISGIAIIQQRERQPEPIVLETISEVPGGD